MKAQKLFNERVAFPSLEELDIFYLGNTSDIWGRCTSFCKLRILSINRCPKLEAVISLGMLIRLRYLESLEILDCNSLRNVFQHSSVARDVMHLKKLEILCCKMMTEIIGEGEQEEEITDDGIIVFPQLTSLRLYELPNLSSFWCYQSGAKTCKVRFPNIVDFQLHGGVINLEDIGLGSDDSTLQVQSLYIECKKKIQLPSKWLVHLYNLERLKLEHCWPHQLKSMCFQQLKVLHVHNSGCSTLFTVSAFRSLHHLQELEISNSDLLEEIVEDVRVDGPDGMDKKTIITLFQLRSVVLKDMPELKAFIHGANYEFHMPALNKVEVDNCGLSTLFTCSVFRKLPQLKDLEVSNCRSLESIVEDVSDEETSDVNNNKIITLPQLSKVYLENLTNLKSFSRTSRYAFNMPKLCTFRLLGCPQTEYFTFLKTSTALVSVHTEWHHWKDIPDLNDYIKQNRQRGSSFFDSAGELNYSDQELVTQV